jgi:hypothetical protein
MEVSRNDTITYGLDLANTFSVVPLKNVFTFANLAKSITTSSLFDQHHQLFAGGAMLSNSSGKLPLKAEVRRWITRRRCVGIAAMSRGIFRPAGFSQGGGYTPPPSFTLRTRG